ncbi:MULTISPECIES: hypothetical protein [unclassified Pseudoalteromonas]|uniref:hypothetical protein n=1 Tax=unclassified Pseudoalteromonas TaxID=194690 RepID=UPI002175A3BA|nr:MULTISPECIES: hypothetical protein [unclassified Pseudoalteromonas]
MIKWILLILTTVFATELYADEAYSQAHCDSIKKEREAIRSQFRGGYSTKESERLTARDKVLFTLLADYCNTPKKASSSYQAISSATTKTSNSHWLLNQKVSNMSLHSDSYSDQAKLDA